MSDSQKKKKEPLNFFMSGDDDDLSSSSDSDEEPTVKRQKQQRAAVAGSAASSGGHGASAAPLPRPDELFKTISKPTFLYNPLNKHIDWESRIVKAPEEVQTRPAVRFRFASF